MKLSIVLLVVGLGAGFAAGYLAAVGGQVDEQECPEQTAAPERTRMMVGVAGHDEAGHPDFGRPVRMVKRIKLPAKKDFADMAACTREVERLATTVEQLARENTEQKRLREYETGKAIPFPEKLDPKFLEPALMKNLNKAFEEVGLDGDVSFVDCDEFPCIVCAGLGAGQGEQADMDETMQKLRKLKESEAMADYKDSQQLNTVVARREESDGGANHTLNNCQAIFPDPEDAKLREELQKRLSWRMNQLSETL